MLLLTAAVVIAGTLATPSASASEPVIPVGRCIVKPGEAFAGCSRVPMGEALAHVSDLSGWRFAVTNRDDCKTPVAFAWYPQEKDSFERIINLLIEIGALVIVARDNERKVIVFSCTQ